MKEYKIKTTGMMCNGCENRMMNAIKTIEGISEVKADHKSGLVTIKCKEEVEKETINHKIEEIGFQIVKED